MGDYEDKWEVAGGVRASLCLFISDFLDTQLPPETIIRVSVMFGERRPDVGDVTDIIQIQREGALGCSLQYKNDLCFMDIEL